MNNLTEREKETGDSIRWIRFINPQMKERMCNYLSSLCAYCLSLLLLVSTTNYRYIHAILLEKKKMSSSTFSFIITTHFQVKRLPDEMRGCETCQKENQITKRQTEGDRREAQRRQIQEEQSFIPSNNTTKKKKSCKMRRRDHLAST